MTVLLILSYLAIIFLLISMLAGLVYLFQSEFQIKIPTLKTNTRVLREFIPQLPLSQSDTVVDLGSGNGSTLFAFETMSSARTIGYELSVIPYLISRIRARLNGYHTAFYRKDFLHTDLSQATVIYTYLFPWMMKKLTPFLEPYIERGATVISCDFPLSCTATETIDIRSHTFYIYRSK